MAAGSDYEYVSANRYREALEGLIKELNIQMTVSKWSVDQRIVLGRVERWMLEALKRADDAGKPPKKSKRRVVDDDD